MCPRQRVHRFFRLCVQRIIDYLIHFSRTRLSPFQVQAACSFSEYGQSPSRLQAPKRLKAQGIMALSRYRFIAISRYGDIAITKKTLLF